MTNRIFKPTMSLFAAFAFVLAALISAPSLYAQGTPDPSGDSAETPHPAHIHSGTCAELGDVVHPLNDVIGLDAAMSAESTPGDAVSSPMVGTVGTPAAGDAAEDGEVIAESTTILEVSLDDITSGEHAVNVHESTDNIQNYIACGDVSGERTDGTLLIDLQELNDSGYTGRAALTGNDDDTTTVTVTLIKSDDMTGTPVASPSS